MKNEEQIKSKLSECNHKLESWEKIYEDDKKDKWLTIIYDLRGKIRVLRWILGYH